MPDLAGFSESAILNCRFEALKGGGVGQVKLANYDGDWRAAAEPERKDVRSLGQDKASKASYAFVAPFTILFYIHSHPHLSGDRPELHLLNMVQARSGWGYGRII